MADRNLNLKVTTTADASKVTNLANQLDKLVAEASNAEQELNKLGLTGRETGKEIENGSRNAERGMQEIIQNAQRANTALNQMGNVGRTSETEISNEAKKAGLSIRESIGSAVDNVKSKFKGLGSSFGAETGAIRQQMQGMGTASHLLLGSIENFGGMAIYNVLDGFVQMGKASMNAEGQLDYFGKRLNLSGQQTNDFRGQLNELQSEFRKVDMRQVGATVEEIAVKTGYPVDKMGELTRMTAVLSSTFVKEGRTQEDAILAVSDALDGQFKRLQEIGITQDKLKENGWNGNLEDQAGLVDALNETMQEMGFEQTAKDITNMDEAMTALTVSGGQLIASVLIPITPYIIQATYGAIDFFEALKSASGTVTSFVSNLPDSAKIILIGGALSIVGGIIYSVIIPALVSSTIGFINWIATALGAEVSAFTLSGAFGLLGTTIWGALTPLLPFIIAFGILALAVYEVGKAFGWWSDIGSMLDAIQGGINRLWSAFINNPNVKATIEDIKNAIDGLWNFLSQVGSGIGEAWNSLFPKGTGEFDIVREIINFFGAIANAGGIVINALKRVEDGFTVFTTIVGIIAGPVGVILSILRPIICILLGCSPGIVPALQKVQEVFSSVFGFVSAFVGMIVGTIVSNLSIIITTVQMIIQVFQLFLNGQITLQQMVLMIWNILTGGLRAIFANIINNVGGFITSFASRMYSGATNAVNNFSNQIKQLPGRLQTELSSMLTYVNTWASTLPQKFWDAGVDAVKNFLSALGIASPGTMQRMLIWEINEMGRRVPEESRGLLRNVNELGSNIVDEYGNPNLDTSNLLNNNLTANRVNGNGGDYNITINIDNVDSEDRVTEIVEAVRRALAWDNTTAGRSV